MRIGFFSGFDLQYGISVMASDNSCARTSSRQRGAHNAQYSRYVSNLLGKGLCLFSVTSVAVSLSSRLRFPLLPLLLLLLLLFFF